MLWIISGSLLFVLVLGVVLYRYHALRRDVRHLRERICVELFDLLESELYRELKDFRKMWERNLKFRPEPNDLCAIEQQVTVLYQLRENDGLYPFVLGNGTAPAHRLYRVLAQLELLPSYEQKLGKVTARLGRKFNATIELAKVNSVLR